MSILAAGLFLPQIAHFNNQELLIVGRGSWPWALNVPVLFAGYANLCSLPGPFFRVVFTVSTLEGYGNVSLWDKEQVCLLLTRR